MSFGIGISVVSEFLVLGSQKIINSYLENLKKIFNAFRDNLMYCLLYYCPFYLFIDKVSPLEWNNITMYEHCTLCP